MRLLLGRSEDEDMRVRFLTSLALGDFPQTAVIEALESGDRMQVYESYPY